MYYEGLVPVVSRTYPDEEKNRPMWHSIPYLFFPLLSSLFFFFTFLDHVPWFNEGSEAKNICPLRESIANATV